MMNANIIVEIVSNFIIWKVAIIAITMKMEKWYSVNPSPPAIIEILPKVSANVINWYRAT